MSGSLKSTYHSLGALGLCLCRMFLPHEPAVDELPELFHLHFLYHHLVHRAR